MKQLLMLLLTAFAVLFSAAQNIGIGTTTPLARLHVADSSVVFSAGGNNVSFPGNPPIQGSGRRMMWYADKGAFRTGYTDNGPWNKDNIGDFSFASGYSTTASGYGATALGFLTIASGTFSTASGSLSKAAGQYATAMGFDTYAYNDYSTALGRNTTAMGDNATAMGYLTTAGGYYATAMGWGSAASGLAATAMGSDTHASGNYSTALGSQTYASGHYSVAMGRKVSTNGFAGAFFFGDSDPNNKGIRPIGFANQMAMRFNGGYYFISSDASGDIGVRLPAGGNSWTAISDARLKENFLPVDGEAILQKITALPQYTWNYKGQDVTAFRHYGPMAQDFYKAFGQDSLGTIGCDTLINQQDFLGVNFIAIQALEKRTAELKEEKEHLKREVDALKARLQQMEKLLLNRQ